MFIRVKKKVKKCFSSEQKNCCGVKTHSPPTRIIWSAPHNARGNILKLDTAGAVGIVIFP